MVATPQVPGIDVAWQPRVCRNGVGGETAGAAHRGGDSVPYP